MTDSKSKQKPFDDEMSLLMNSIAEFQKSAESNPELYKTLREQNSHITTGRPTPYGESKKGLPHDDERRIP